MTEEESPKKGFGQIFNEAQKNPNILRIYANYSINVNTPTDISMLLFQNNTPIAFLNISYEMAKTITKQLMELIANVENKSENKILDASDIIKSLQDGDSDAQEIL